METYCTPSFLKASWGRCYHEQEMNWHKKSVERLTAGERFSDWLADGIGSWGFLIFQTIFVCVWLGLNIWGIVAHWDVYPFVLLNLIFSIQASYAGPIIMMSQNRQEK